MSGDGASGLGPLETVVVLGFGFIAGVPSALYLAWRLSQAPRDQTNPSIDHSARQEMISSI